MVGSMIYKRPMVYEREKEPIELEALWLRGWYTKSRRYMEMRKNAQIYKSVVIFSA